MKMGYVKAGQPDKSIIYRYLKGVNIGGPENMPPKVEFNDQERLLVKNWIVNLEKSKKMVSSSSLVKVSAVNKLSDTAILRRCSRQFTNMEPEIAAKELLDEVRKGVITGSFACRQLLERASLDKDGVLKSNNEVAQNILLNFQKVHNNWFNEWNFFTSMSTWGTFEILDPGVMGLYFTRSLFDENFSLKQILKGNESFEGYRESKFPQQYLQHKFKDEPRYKVADYKFVFGHSFDGEYKNWNPQRVPTGKLMGVKRIPYNRDILPIMVNSKDNQEEIRPAKELKVNKDIHKGLGGGLLGNENYISLNLGQELGTSMDGGRVIPRRWAAAVVKELLCRELPVVPIITAKKFVQKNSSLSFRKEASCMGCHTTMDNLAYLARNVEQGYSADAGGDGMIHSTHLRTYYPKKYLKAEMKAPDKDKDFHLRPAHGRFIYNDVYNKAYDVKVESLDQLGEIITNLDDFYLCTAKKYFKFLTGSDVSMDIFGASKLSKKELYYKQLLESSAREMRKTGDLKDGLNSLINSEVYSSSGFDVNPE
jgi:hypothetical protein